MIKSLYLKNFALFKEIQICFDNGLNIITGETGSGKSLLLKSLKFLRGERFSKDFIRDGENRCILEVEYGSGITTIIRRVFHVDGRSRTFINDEPVSIEKLREVSNSLLNYHGQHENQKLFNTNEQLNILSHFASVESKVFTLQNLYYQINKNSRLIDELEKKKRNFMKEQEIIEFQLNEISQTKFELGDDIILTKNLKKLSHQSDIKNKLDDSIKIYKMDISEKLGQIRRNIECISNIDEDFNIISNRIDGIICELDDISLDMGKETLNHIPDQNEIQMMNDTLSHLEMLKRKYGGSLEAVFEYQNEIMDKIKVDSTVNKDLKKLKENRTNLILKYKKLSHKISKERKKEVPIFIKLIEKNISKLGMKNTKFHVELNELDKEKFFLFGNDKCEFNISAKKLGEAKSISKIASGGEISRIQLAIKMLKINSDLNETLVFDEIDTGISGRIADMTGKVMKEISNSQQVLCITHLPQIAGKGHHHFVSNKIVTKIGTEIRIKKLNNNEKVDEIASLMSGNKITQTSKARAKEILKVY